MCLPRKMDRLPAGGTDEKFPEKYYDKKCVIKDINIMYEIYTRHKKVT